jgi:hypothetical protein
MEDNNPNGHKGRNGSGQFTKSLEGAQRDAHAARLHADGASYNEIAAELGIHKSQAIRAVQRAVRAVVKGPAEDVLKLHTDRLEYAFTKMVEIMEADHVVVSHGKIITDEQGNPLRDHGPVIAATREARQLLDSFRVMMGYNQPVKVDATVHEVTQQDVELQALVREAKARMWAEEQGILDGGTEG